MITGHKTKTSCIAPPWCFDLNMSQMITNASFSTSFYRLEHSVIQVGYPEIKGYLIIQEIIWKQLAANINVTFITTK